MRGNRACDCQVPKQGQTSNGTMLDLWSKRPRTKQVYKPNKAETRDRSELVKPVSSGLVKASDQRKHQKGRRETQVINTKAETNSSLELPVYILDNGQDKSSVILEVFGKHYRALVDSGAAISIIHRRVREQFPNAETIRSTQVKLQAATGDAIRVVGEIDLRIRLGKKIS